MRIRLTGAPDVEDATIEMDDVKRTLIIARPVSNDVYHRADRQGDVWIYRFASREPLSVADRTRRAG